MAIWGEIRSSLNDGLDRDGARQSLEVVKVDE
jgi:hypothetical protein